MSFEDGHPGGYLGYGNGTISAIMNNYVAPMSHIKYGLNLTCGRRCRLKNFKMAAVAAVLDIRAK